jgi:long-chain acyl-CoA synthetase
MDEDGYFYIVDRKKDMISASGLKVLPREVEEVLYLHPAVQEAVVAGVPDTYRGETVKAFIVLKAGVHATVEELTQFCKLHMASFKVPTQIEFVRSCRRPSWARSCAASWSRKRKPSKRPPNKAGVSVTR